MHAFFFVEMELTKKKFVISYQISSISAKITTLISIKMRPIFYILLHCALAQ